MKVVRTIAECRAARREFSALGFVPTMGAFHEGHLSLMRAAKAACGSCAVSLFVNPLQFAPTDDLAKYPRQHEQDFAMAESVGVDLMFVPDPAELTQNTQTNVLVLGVSELYEGERRPGHFEGVATIVAKLFGIVQPDTAFFGLKDLQQCAVIRRMVNDLNMPLALQFEETVREPSGLAMSSRNQYFSPEQKAEASYLYRVLTEAAERLAAGASDPTLNLKTILDEAVSSLSGRGFGVEYLDAVDPQTMLPITHIEQDSRLVVAAKFHTVRLIDNIPVFINP